jgi:hypothetical protein
VRLRLYKNATKWSKKIFLKLDDFWARQHHRRKKAVEGTVAFLSSRSRDMYLIVFAVE